jgi:hypothetical protein
MTRDECLTAIDEVYGAFTFAPIDSWDIVVESTPTRNIVLAPSFVDANITGNKMTRASFLSLLQKTPDSAWQPQKNGSLHLFLK